MNRAGNTLREEADVVWIGRWRFVGGAREWGGTDGELWHVYAIGEGDGGAAASDCRAHAAIRLCSSHEEKGDRLRGRLHTKEFHTKERGAFRRRFFT
eukprot:scaffold29020_cov171-Skeletonema_menzelii.AAC.2